MGTTNDWALRRHERGQRSPESLCTSITLTNFVVVVAGFLWPTSSHSHKSTSAFSAAREGAGVESAGEIMLSRMCSDAHAYVKGFCACGMLHRMVEMLSKISQCPPFTVRNPVDQNRANRC
ncbi:hypothetical protein FIBSPDRAFT_64989 [Athelia psychrophila]|uniref:Uncharacterized protein n=1 Tax=Athelia psychrophila TaxID=1759441 RepID=A0A166EW61_9AGAM|nr:hypothetical protein FIBSPDRAFT_64989 [Fibularhizoctonia sp. CBS 109695]